MVFHERLEEVVEEKPETKQQLVQRMGLLRATIPHRRRVRLLRRAAGDRVFDVDESLRDSKTPVTE